MPKTRNMAQIMEEAIHPMLADTVDKTDYYYTLKP
jgi:hypothetical protein